MLLQQVNATDSQGISRDCAERMTVTILSPVYSYLNLRHRVKSLKCSYEMITGKNNFFTKKIVECVDKIEKLENTLTRGQNKKPRFLTEVMYMVTKKLLIYIESCRDALEGEPLTIRHLNFDGIWLKVKMGKIFDITLPPCLERKFKDPKSLKGAPQDTGQRFKDGSGGFDSHKRGKEPLFRKNGDMGETVHSNKLKKNLMIKGEEYGSIIYNFMKFEDNKNEFQPGMESLYA